MNYKLNSFEDAIRLGQHATRQDCQKMVKAMRIFDAQYQYQKMGFQDLHSFNTRLKLAIWKNLLREALEEASYVQN